MLRRYLLRRSLRKQWASACLNVLVAAKAVESSYDPQLIYAHDPVYLADLRDAVKQLRAIDAQLAAL